MQPGRGDAKSFVYVAGQHEILDALHTEFELMAGSPERWERRLAELRAGGRWMELLY